MTAGRIIAALLIILLAAFLGILANPLFFFILVALIIVWLVP